MKVLLVGNGAREHAMGEALAKDVKLYVAMKAKNPGLVGLAKQYAIGDILDAPLILEKARGWGVDYCVIGPEAPLGAGLSDLLEKEGIPCASPSKAAAQVELDKSYCRELMKKHNCRGRVAFEKFDDAKNAAEFIDVYGKPVVVKTLGLNGGKGVKMMADLPGQVRDASAAKE